MTAISASSRTAPRTTRRPLAPIVAGLLVSALVVGLTACGSGDSGGDESSSGGPGGSLPPGDVVIVAENIAWNTDELEAPADTDFTIVIDNRDSGVQHNLTIEDSEFSSPLEPGVSAQVLRINLPAGEYGFICDLHPNMAGTLTVS